jgi:hypothetical protein
MPVHRVVPGKRPNGVIGLEKFPPYCQVISDFAGNLLEMRQECDMKGRCSPPQHMPGRRKKA